MIQVHAWPHFDAQERVYSVAFKVVGLHNRVRSGLGPAPVKPAAAKQIQTCRPCLACARESQKTVFCKPQMLQTGCAVYPLGTAAASWQAQASGSLRWSAGGPSRSPGTALSSVSCVCLFCGAMCSALPLVSSCALLCIFGRACSIFDTQLPISYSSLHCLPGLCCLLRSPHCCCSDFLVPMLISS